MNFSGPLEDRQAIRELNDTYADGVNQRSLEIWASTWTDDSAWKLPIIPGMENVQGKENITQAWLGGMELFPYVFMSISIGSIHVDGDTATARAYTSEVAVMQDGNEIRPRGQYDDKLVKIDGQWYFKERVFNTLHGE